MFSHPGQAIHQQQPCDAAPALGSMVGCGFGLMMDSSANVREYALEATTGLAGLLDAERQEKLFGPAVQGCLTSADVGDRVSGVRLLGRLSMKGIYLGSEGTVIDWVTYAMKDANPTVRQVLKFVRPLPPPLSSLNEIMGAIALSGMGVK